MAKYNILLLDKDLDLQLNIKLSSLEGVIIPFDSESKMCSYIYIHENHLYQIEEIKKHLKFINLNQYIDENQLKSFMVNIKESNKIKLGSYIKHVDFANAPLMVTNITKNKITTEIKIRNKTFIVEDDENKFQSHPNPMIYLYDIIDIPKINGIISVDCEYLNKHYSTFEEIIKFLLRIKYTNQNRSLVFINPNNISREVATAIGIPTISHFIPSEIIVSDKRYLYHYFKKALTKVKIHIKEIDTSTISPVLEAIKHLKATGVIGEQINLQVLESQINNLDEDQLAIRFKKYWKQIIKILNTADLEFDNDSLKNNEIKHDYSIFEKHDMYWYIENFDMYQRVIKY